MFYDQLSKYSVKISDVVYISPFAFTSGCINNKMHGNA